MGYSDLFAELAGYLGKGIGKGAEEELAANTADRRAMQSFRRLTPLRAAQQEETLAYESKAGEQRLARDTRAKQEIETRESESALGAVGPYLSEMLATTEFPGAGGERRQEATTPYRVPAGTRKEDIYKLLGVGMAREKAKKAALPKAPGLPNTPFEAHLSTAQQALGEPLGSNPSPRALEAAQKAYETQAGTIAGSRLTGTEAVGPTRQQRLQFGQQYETALPTRNFINAKDAYARIEEAGKQTGPIGDVALIYGVMRMLDPTSVVKEGEFNTARKTAAIPDRVWYAAEQLWKGELLTPQQRKEFMELAKRTFSGHVKNQVDFEESSKGFAGSAGMGPESVPDVMGRYRPRPGRILKEDGDFTFRRKP